MASQREDPSVRSRRDRAGRKWARARRVGDEEVCGPRQPQVASRGRQQQVCGACEVALSLSRPGSSCPERGDEDEARARDGLSLAPPPSLSLPPPPHPLPPSTSPGSHHAAPGAAPPAGQPPPAARLALDLGLVQLALVVGQQRRRVPSRHLALLPAPRHPPALDQPTAHPHTLAVALSDELGRPPDPSHLVSPAHRLEHSGSRPRQPARRPVPALLERHHGARHPRPLGAPVRRPRARALARRAAGARALPLEPRRRRPRPHARDAVLWLREGRSRQDPEVRLAVLADLVDRGGARPLRPRD